MMMNQNFVPAMRGAARFLGNNGASQRKDVFAAPKRIN